MADKAEDNPQPGIAALPPTTVRQIGSHQLLTDSSSVVKELIDNALDARAKSIFIEITANTIDSIQVKDDGHGIPGEDRALACRRYCTSKIRDFRDLKEVGGKWLGFRGEALASIADMSGMVSITTRVEGEPVAVKLTYQRNGELLSTERDSHPVGTTVKVTKFLDSAKVRKELAIKGSAKCLTKIRRLVQAYALARSAVRFRLHVLKAKNNKSDFVYAPKANANVEDAALKIIGKECALQCDWTALELDDFELHAFLPKPTASGTKIANHGAFISVDSRPVSPARGTLKKIATAVRDKLRKANRTLAGVKDPFFYLNIICPVDSYDPNIEPAKDDVIFSDKNFFLKLVDRLLVSYYPDDRTTGDAEVDEDAMVMQPTQTFKTAEASPPPHIPLSLRRDASVVETEISNPAAHEQPRWRSSMYGIDAEDLEFLQQNAPPAVEEEGCGGVEVSNPWTIARMNAPIRSKRTVVNTQLLSPTKSQSDVSTASQSPVAAATPRQSRPDEPPAPRTSSQNDTYGNQLDEELQRSIHRLPHPVSQDSTALGHDSATMMSCTREMPSLEDRMSPNSIQSVPQSSFPKTTIAVSTAPRRKHRPQQPFEPYVPPTTESDDTWFGQPMRNAPKASRPQRRPRHQGLPFFPSDGAFSSQKSLVLPAAERVVETRLTPENNTDIRDFFSQPRHAPRDMTCPGDSQPQHIASQLRAHAEQASPDQSSPCRPHSAAPYPRSSTPAQEMAAMFTLHSSTSPAAAPSALHYNQPAHAPSTPAPRPRRRRTTDAGTGLQRTKSATLPLNRIPRGFETHNLRLRARTSVARIAQLASRLDLSKERLQWGRDAADAFDVFGGRVSEREVMAWVVRVDGMLDGVFGRVDGVEVRGRLHEGVQRFLDVRNGEVDGRNVRAGVDVDTDSSVGVRDDVLRSGHGAVAGLPTRGLPHHALGGFAHTEHGVGAYETVPGNERATAAAAVKPDEDEEFGISQLAELDGDVGAQSVLVPTTKIEDDFGDDVEDEMLMDL